MQTPGPDSNSPYQQERFGQACQERRCGMAKPSNEGRQSSHPGLLSDTSGDRGPSRHRCVCEFGIRARYANYNAFDEGQEPSVDK